MAKGKYQQWLTHDGLLMIEGWARDGLTDEQIAKNIGVNKATFYRWCEQYCDIRDALKRGKAPVDYEVENALLKRALGYDYEEETQELKWDQKAAEYRLKTTKKIRKHVPPSETAMIFWLKNRKKEHWRDRQDFTLAAEVEDLDEVEEEIYGVTGSSSEKKDT